MSRLGVPVKLQPRTLACHAVTAWHSDSAVLVSSFEYGADPRRAPPTGSIEENSMMFGLNYYVNRVASIDLDVRVLWDAGRSRIALRFGSADPANERWVAIADNVFVCVDGQQTLIEIRFESVQIESGDPPN